MRASGPFQRADQSPSWLAMSALKILEMQGDFHYTSQALAQAVPALKPGDAQVAQSVERSPEKAGVGGSIPSLGTIDLPVGQPSSPPIYPANP